MRNSLGILRLKERHRGTEKFGAKPGQNTGAVRVKQLKIPFKIIGEIYFVNVSDRLK